MRESLTNNPYLQSKLLWNDMYGSVQRKLENSYRIIFILAICLIFLTSALIYLSLSTHIQPFVVMLRGNELVTVNELKSDEFKTLQPKIALNLASKFIHDVRANSQDSQVNKLNQVRTYAFVSGQAATFLDEYYKNKRRSLISIEIHTLMIKENGTIDIRWIEKTRYSNSGKLRSVRHYSAEIHYQFTQPSRDPVISQHNPLGFYITHIAWAKDIMES